MRHEVMNKAKPLKFRNAHVNAQGNVKFLRPGQKRTEHPTVSLTSKMMQAGTQNQTVTNLTSVGVSAATGGGAGGGQVQFVTSQGTPVISGSSIIVPQIGSMPILQSTGNPVQIIQRTTILHGTGKTPATPGQTFPIVGSSFPTGNIHIVQNQASQGVQLLQNQPQASVQILQNSPQGSIQFLQSQPQMCIESDSQTVTQPHASLQVLSSQHPGVQLVSNPAQFVSSQVPGSMQVGQQPTLQMVQTQSGGLQLLSPGMLEALSMLSLPSSINVLSPQNVPQAGVMQTVTNDGKSGGNVTIDKTKVKANASVPSGVSPVLKHLLKPKFGTSAMNTNSKPAENSVTKLAMKLKNKKKELQKLQTGQSTKLPELLPKRVPLKENSDAPKDETGTGNEIELDGPDKSKLSESVGEGLNKSDDTTDAEKDEDLVVIINKEQQNNSSEDAQLSFAGTSVKPKFAIEFSPTNLQAYVQAVANAVENHKALFEQSKSDVRHKKKKSKHKSKDLEVEMYVEPPREIATTSKSSRRKQTLSVRKDPSDNGGVLPEAPKSSSRRKRGPVEPELVIYPFPPEPAVKSSTSSKSESMKVSSGSIVTMKETSEDVCVDVVGESEPREVQTVPKEIGVFIPPSLSKCIGGTSNVQPQCVVEPKKTGGSSKAQGSPSAPPVTKVTTNTTPAPELPIPVDEIKTEPKDKIVPQQVKQKGAVSTEVLKKLLTSSVVRDRNIPGFSTVYMKTLDVSGNVSQKSDKTKKNVLPVPVQWIKEEPVETADVSVEKSSKKCLASEPGEFGNLTAIASMSSPLNVPINAVGEKTVQAAQSPLENPLKMKLKEKVMMSNLQASQNHMPCRGKLKEKLDELRSASHHYSPVREATALQKVITAFAQETQTNEPKTKAKTVQSNHPAKQTNYPSRASNKTVTPNKIAYSLLGSKTGATRPCFVPKPAEPAPKVMSPPVPLSAPPPGSMTLAPPATTNIAKLMGPFSIVQNPTPVANLPLTGSDTQQKQVFIVPNSVYSALLTAQASTGKTVQLTSSQLFAGKVLPTDIPTTLPSTLPLTIPSSLPSCFSSNPNCATPTATLSTPLQTMNDQDKNLPVKNIDDSILQVSQQSSGPCVKDEVKTSIPHNQSQGVVQKPFKDLPSDSVQPQDSKENVEDLGKISLELKIDSVFSLNKVSCKLLDKVPSYLDMCLNSEHEHSLKLCFVVLDRKLPPIFRGKTGTKRTRQVAPKVCPLDCRTDALDSMCLKNKWLKVKLTETDSQEDIEPVIKRAKTSKKVSAP